MTEITKELWDKYGIDKYFVNGFEYEVGYDFSLYQLKITPPDGCTGGHIVVIPCKYINQLYSFLKLIA